MPRWQHEFKFFFDAARATTFNLSTAFGSTGTHLQFRQVACASAATFHLGFYCFGPSNSPVHQRRCRLIFQIFCGTATATTAVAGWLFSRFFPGSLSVIIIFDFEPTLCCHCNYGACSGCMQWQHGDVGDQLPPPHPTPQKMWSTTPPAFSALSGQGANLFLWFQICRWVLLQRSATQKFLKNGASL